MILRAVLSLVLLLSTTATFFVAGLFVAGTTESLRSRVIEPTRSVVDWLCFPLVAALYLSIPIALMVVFRSHPALDHLAILLLSLPAILVPLIVLIDVLTYGWEELVGHPAAHGGRPPSRLAEIGRLVLVQGLLLPPPVTAWLLVSFD